MNTNARIGMPLRQRIRESIWKVLKERAINPNLQFNEGLTKKLQPTYRETYVTNDPIVNQTYISIRGKCVIETHNGQDQIKNYMKSTHLPGCQITLRPGEPPVVEWLCWYDGFIFSDGEAETITSDPYENRNFSLNDEDKDRLKKTIMVGVERRERNSLKDGIFIALRETFRETYKERFIDADLMPDITMQDLCVIDITNRNRGFVMNFDVFQMKKYMHELIIPGVLVNFTDGVLSTFVWFSCRESKLEMAIEIMNEIPNEELTLEHKDNIKTIIRESVIGVHQDKTLHEEKEYRTELMNRIKNFFPNTFKDRFLKGHMPDITIEDECIIDVRTRNRGIVMDKDRHAMKGSMIDLNLPAVQINFIDGSSAVILWFSCRNRNMNIELEPQGEDMKGSSLVDFL